VSVSAPERGFGLDPFETDVFRPRRVDRRRQQRLRRRRARIRAVAVVAILALAAGAYLVFVRGGKPAPPPPPVAAPPAVVVDPTTAWSVRIGNHVFLAVVAAPKGGRPVAVAIPEETVVDVPGGGPSRMGQADQSVEMLIAATQATLERRVAHAVISDQADLAILIDTLGGVDVQLGEPTLVGGVDLGPGTVTMLGAEAVDYLNGGTAEDRTIRWESLLQGLVDAPANPQAWSALAGSAHPGAADVFDTAADADVLELPTVQDDLGISTDPEGVADLVATRFPAGGELVKVVVLTGIGRPGVVVDVIRRVAPAGYWVVATQEAAERPVDTTQVVAGDDGFLEDAEAVRDVLGVGTVYVGTQPTGVADVTIVVGKDYIAG
jgi:LytR cell envelope-related transcriptional attenuator/LytR_cpsA_psr family